MSTELSEITGRRSEEARMFPAMLEKYKSEIARALPQHMNGDRMARIALTAFRQTPTLAHCDPRSVFAAVIQSAQLGLEVGLMGEAHLVPFSKNKKNGDQWVKTTECQLIPGYQGLIKLARNSGLVKDIYAHEVRAKDKFVVTLGLHRDLVHEPLMRDGFPAPDEERGAVTGFYAVALFKDGTTSFVALPVHKVNRIRDRSAGYIAAEAAAKKYSKPNNSPWATDYEAMGIKTAIRALCKFMPKSPELATALALDEAASRGMEQGLETGQIIDGSWAPPNEEDDQETPPEGESKPPPAANTVDSIKDKLRQPATNKAPDAPTAPASAPAAPASNQPQPAAAAAPQAPASGASEAPAAPAARKRQPKAAEAPAPTPSGPALPALTAPPAEWIALLEACAAGQPRLDFIAAARAAGASADLINQLENRLGELVFGG